MATVSEIYQTLCEMAPPELQLPFDNAGFLLGRGDAEVHHVLLALDVTDTVVEEAEEEGAELIISHHPLIFHPVKALVDTDPATARLLRLIERQIAVISMHTNLDIVSGGVNDVLLSLLGAEGNETLDDENCGRIGLLPEEQSMSRFLANCKSLLKTAGLRYYDAGKPVRRLAVMGGSGGDAIDIACQKGCDTYVTADIKYHQFLRAQELGMNLIDADHFCTENPVVFSLRERLSRRFPELCFSVSARHQQVIRFF